MCLLLLVVVSFGVALTLKAAIGVGAWDALSQTGSNLSGIRVGTVGMLMNFACVLLELLILRRDFKINHLMQMVISAVIGYCVNFFFYDVLGNVELTNYFSRVALLLAAYALNAVTGGCLIMLNVGTFAVEGACKVIGDKIGKPFHVLRQGVDIISIVICVLLAICLKTPLTIREGTVLGMLVYGPIMGISVKLFKPIFQKYDLTDEK